MRPGLRPGPVIMGSRPQQKHKLEQSDVCHALTCLERINHGSLFCLNMRQIYVDLSQLRHLHRFCHLRRLRHVIYVTYVSVFNFTSPLRGCGAPH
jgi:hypothetical protein